MRNRVAWQEPLLAWYAANRRELPWRGRDAYAVWVSEVMLQQTQVATVVPYFEKFLARFPTVGALAAAGPDEVLARWSGLGYYARARNLHRAAKAIVERHGGELPRDVEALGALPGFGPYTTGAVGSIGLGLDAPVVDGNVARVLCRVEGWEVGAEDALRQAWSLAPALLPAGRAGDWNQALMELGQRVCTPSSPRCDACPVRASCVASRREPARFPLPKVRPAKKKLHLVALAIRDGARVLLVRADGDGLFGGTWALPAFEVGEGESPGALALARARALAGPRARVEPAPLVRQALTHREVTVEPFLVAGGRPKAPEHGRLVAPEELSSLGIATLAAKVLRAARVALPDGHGRRRTVDPAQRRLL